MNDTLAQAIALVLVAVLVNWRVRNPRYAMALVGAVTAVWVAAVAVSIFGVAALRGSLPALGFMFMLGAFVGGVVAMPFLIIRNRNGAPPAAGPQQPNNALERTVKKRGAPLRREAASWPSAQLGR